MIKEGSITLALIVFSLFLVAFMDDSLNMDHDIINMKKSTASELAKDFEFRYEVVRFTIKNYYPETTRFNLSLSGAFASGDPMVDSCPDVIGKFCLSNGTIIVKYPSRAYIAGHAFDDLIMDIGVREDAEPGRYQYTIVVESQNKPYAVKTFTLNVGERNFIYGAVAEEETMKKGMGYLVFFAFLCAILVFGMVIISKGRH